MPQKKTPSPFDIPTGPSAFATDTRFKALNGKSAAQIASDVVDGQRKRNGKCPGTIPGLNKSQPTVNVWAKK